MSHLGVSFDEALSFVTSKRHTVCPNGGFVEQLWQFEVSKDRAALGRDLRRGAGYEEIYKRDFDEVTGVEDEGLGDLATTAFEAPARSEAVSGVEPDLRRKDL
eukprot:15463937-Alexandrium_andersonii.AAC.1